MELHPKRIVAEIDGAYYELITINQAAEILCLSYKRVKNLMFGTKHIPSKLNYVTVPEFKSKQPYSHLRVVVDNDFRDVAMAVANKEGKKNIPKIGWRDSRF